MNIKIICVGKLKEKYWKQGIAEYSKRLGKFCKFEIVEVPDEKAPEKLSEAQMENVKKTEGERILGKITTYGRRDLAFVIGGSLGLSEDVLKRADSQISFGRFTMPHQLMRLVLTEQIYRAFMINSGSPYHK